MSGDFFSQLRSILNINNQQQQQQQPQQQQHQQQQQPQIQMPFEQHQQQQQQPHYSTLRASSTSPYNQLEQQQHLHHHQQQQQQRQEQDFINSLSSIPLPQLSQLPKQQQQQEIPSNEHHQLRNPFHNLQQINHQHHPQLHQQQQQQQQQHRPPSSTGNIINNPIESSQIHSSPQQQQQQQQQPSGEQQKKPARSREETEFPAEFNYMPGTASLIEDIDKQLMVILRDGRTLIGYLRSIDQYANLLLSSTIERIHVGTKYGDIPRGIYMIRGENVVLLGEVDFNIPLKVNMTKVSVEEILELKRIEQKKQEEEEKAKKKALLDRCLIPHTDGILDEYY